MMRASVKRALKMGGQEMPYSVNEVRVLGNVGKDPEIRSTQGGNKIANFSVATSENWTDKQSGEKKERTEWHHLVVFGSGLVNVVENYVKKGSKVDVFGSLRTRKWQDQSGQDRYSTEIVVSRIGLLGDPQQRDGERRESGASYGGGGTARQAGGGQARTGSNGSVDPRYGGPQQGGRTALGNAGHDSGRGPAWAGDLDDEVPF